MARRLTANLSEASHPALSPDGAWIAFTGRDAHHPEVYRMPAAGGPAQRLTWLGTRSIVRGWTPDGRILFVSNAGQPFRHLLHAYAVAPEGGPVERLPYGPVRDAAFGPAGAVVLGRNTEDPARWKRYRGGAAGELWIDRWDSGDFRPLLALAGNLASPMWLGDRVWFLSDHEGVGNLYSCLPDGTDLRRHTDHDEYYARCAQTDGRRIVYQHAAEIWGYEPEHGTGGPVAVDLRSPRVQRARRFVPADRCLSGWALHPDGHTIALETRGKLFTMPLWEPPVHQHGTPDGVRYRLAQWVGDGSALVAVSDEGGEEHIEVHRPDEPKPHRLDGLDLGCITELATAPEGPLVAVANQRQELFLVDLEAATARLLDRCAASGLGDVAWSPDGRWLAYSFGVTANTRSIKLCELASGATHLVTPPTFRDGNPSWDPEGRYLYFLSYRTFDQVSDSLFDLGFTLARPYLVILSNEEPSPFAPESQCHPPVEPSEPAEPIRIDLEGIGGRVLAIPVPMAAYSQVVGIRGKALLCSWSIEAGLGQAAAGGEGVPMGSLEAYDLTERRHDVLVGGISGFTVSGDGRMLCYRSGQRLRAIPAGEAPPGDESPGRHSGWLDLDRVRVSVDPGAEWAQMLQDAWRLQRDHFWAEDMSGVDWARALDRYLPLVERVATRGELSDLMWELQGELGTSHAYEQGGDYRPAPDCALGHLAADLTFDSLRGRWRFTHIVTGDPWDPQSGSPLRTPGVGVTPGDVLLAVNGRPVDVAISPASLLVNQAGLAVELTVAGPDGQRQRDVVVTALPDERGTRYREWAATNRAKVHAATSGRVGYVHVPDTGLSGYAEFNRAHLSEAERDALIVDVRYNDGGQDARLMLEKLTRRRLGCTVSRSRPPQPYPAGCPAGPLVAVTNEYTASAGDVLAHCFKLLGLGPVVGRRTWGGTIRFWPKQLVDGSVTTQPESAFWFADVGWGVENHGVDPDVEVDIRPQDARAGEDPQLDKAIELALAALRSHQPLAPDLLRRPHLGLPVLPAEADVGWLDEQ
ncbi:MAG: S41 family peptidase [Egibacteraceae bacterium]